MNKEITIKLRECHFKIFGDIIAECIIDEKKYGGVGFGEWYAIKSLAQNIIKEKNKEDNGKRI